MKGNQLLKPERKWMNLKLLSGTKEVRHHRVQTVLWYRGLHLKERQLGGRGVWQLHQG